MAEEKVIMLDFVINVNTGTDLSPDWTKIGGRKDLMPNIATTKVDLSDCDSGGWADERIVGHSGSFTVTANRLEDPDDGSRDPGQAAVEAVMFETGTAAILGFQIITPGGEEWTFKASVECQPFGGGSADGAGWSATLSLTEAPILTPV